MRVTFICSGNTCRSPMAERMLKYHLEKAGITDVEVCSRGFCAVEKTPMNKLAVAALKQLDIKCPPHKAKCISMDTLQKSDMIIVMTERHKSRLGALPRVFTLGELTSCGEVADPYGGDSEIYTACANQLMQATEKLVPIILRLKSL